MGRSADSQRDSGRGGPSARPVLLAPLVALAALAVLLAGFLPAMPPLSPGPAATPTTTLGPAPAVRNPRIGLQPRLTD